MNIDGNQNYFTPEEARQIRHRIMELPALGGPEAEIGFHQFLECLRRNADLYASLLFGQRNVKLVSFNLVLGTAVVKDEEDTVWSVNLRFDKP